MGTGAANVVLILGDVGEMRKKAEGTDDLKRFCGRQVVQRRREFSTCRKIFVSAKADRALANTLDDVEHSLAALLAHRVAEDAAKQTDVLAQGEVLVVGIDFG
jgi:hypothetical protein